MKRVISILLALALIIFCFISAKFIPEETITTNIPIDTLPLCITDYELSTLYTCKQDSRNENPSIIEVNQIDANLLMKIAREEGGDSLNGQLWAMRVIYNRLLNGNFGDSIWDIVSSTGQFEVFTTGAYINADVNVNSHIALAMIESGWDETQGALYWRTDSGSTDSWHERKLEYIATIEGNRYYK